jgi:hypothetical protein
MFTTFFTNVCVPYMKRRARTPFGGQRLPVSHILTYKNDLEDVDQ